MKVEENTRWSRWSGMSRRRFLQTGATAGVGAAGFALVGCGDDDDDDDENGGNTPSTGETPAQGQPKTGGRLQEINTEPDQYDPHRDAGYPGLFIIGAVYNGLLRTRVPIGEDFVLEGDLAEDLPEQPDDTTYVYRLRDGIKWQNVDPTNGRAMTSEDIAKNFDRMQTDKPDYVLRPMFSMIDSIDTPDDLTVRVNLKEPYGQFAVNTADIWAKVIPPELYDGDQSKVHPVGSGPFIFESAQQGVGQTLNRNPDYFREGQPYLDGIDFVIVQDAAVRAASFQAGELDTLRSTAIPVMEQLQADYSDANYDKRRLSVLNPFMINNAVAPFDNPLVRRAIYHAIDPELVINLQYQGLAVQGQPLTAWLTRYALAENEIPAYDPAEAKRLLEAAGLPDGFTFTNKTFQNGTGAFGTLQVQQSLAEVGIKMENQELEWADWRANVYGIKGDFEVTMGGEFDYISPDRQLYNAFYSEGSANNRHVDDPDLDKLLIDARQELDETAQVEKYKATAKYLVDNAVSVWLPQGQDFVATQPWVKGWFWQYSAGALFERNFMDEVWLDRE